MTGRLTQLARGYQELLIVAVAAVIGLTAQEPLARVVDHQGINVLLMILVFATAITIEPQSLVRLPTSWRPLSLALTVGACVLPTLSWLTAHVVAPGPLRDGLFTLGIAPCEIASIATTGMAGGDVALAGGLLIGSTMLTVAMAGPILALESPGTTIHPGHILLNLLVVVALPLAAGVIVRTLTRLSPRGELIAAKTSTLAVAALVALVAAEVHLSTSYWSVAFAVVVFLVASALLGRVIGLGGGSAVAKALLLTTSIRDFAIAAALATTAFGAAAAAPLGVYGVVVLVWGTGSAGFMRSRASP